MTEAEAALQAMLALSGGAAAAIVDGDMVTAVPRRLAARFGRVHRATASRLGTRLDAAGADGVALAVDAAGLDARTAVAFARAGQRWLWHARLPRGRVLIVASNVRRAPPKPARQAIAALARPAPPDVLGGAADVLQHATASLAADTLPTFFDTLLLKALHAAGTGHGALVLIDGEQARPVAIAEDGRILPPAAKRALGIDTLPFGAVGRRTTADIARHADGRIDTPQAFPRALRGYLRRQGMGAIVSVALQVGDRVVGTLAAGYRDAAAPAPERRALLRLVAGAVAMAVELTRAGELARTAAVERERAETAESRVGQLLRATNALTQAIGTATPRPAIETVLRYTLAAMCEPLIGAGVGMLWLVDGERATQRRHLVYAGARVVGGAESGLPDGGADLPLGRVMRDPRFVRGEPYPLPADELAPARRMVMDAHGCDRLMVFPMALGGRPIGGFFLMLPAGRRGPGPEDLRFAQALAQQALLALELTRLAEAAGRTALAREREAAARLRAVELAKANGALKQALDLISDDLDIGDTLGRLLVVTAGQLDCAQATLCLRDDDAEAFRVVAVVDGVPRAVTPALATRHLCPPADGWLWRELVAARRPLVVAAGGSDGADAWLADSGAHMLLVVPLVQRGEVIGCLTFRFDAARELPAEQMELVQALAHQATLSVQLERLARAAERKTHHAATLAERARIARDLHDTLAQGLTGILMHLQASQRTHERERAAAHVQAALEAARGAIVDAGRSVYALRSMTHERAELLPSLRGILRTTFAGSDVAADVAGNAPAIRLAEDAQAELLRIAQEAATNTLKHARASRFQAFVNQIGDGVEVWLCDDGAGFDTAADRDGFGLMGIGERAERIGAGLEIRSRPGAGTEIVVRVPAP